MDDTQEPTKSDLATSFKAAMGSMQLILDYILADTRRNHRSFAIGSSTVLIVVLFLTLIQNTLLRANLVFVRLAEDSVGSFDLLVLPDLRMVADPAANPFLNYTYLNQSLNKPGTEVSNYIEGAAPRWILRANITKPDDNSTKPLMTSAVVLVMDQDWEKQIGQARLWSYRRIGTGECHASASLLRALQVQPNQGRQINLNISLIATLQSQFGNATTISPDNGNGTLTNGTTPGSNTGLLPNQIEVPIDTVLGPIPIAFRQPLLDALNITNSSIILSTDFLLNTLSPTNLLNNFIQCTVIDAIDDTYGKYPSALGNVVVLEKEWVEQIARSTLNQIAPFFTNGTTAEFIRSFKLEDYAMMSVITLKDRYNLYAGTSTERKASLMKASNEVALAVGMDHPIQMQQVLGLALEATQFIQIFLNEIFFTVLVVLVVLAFILIASLMVSDADEKTFEYGMLRTLGFRSRHIIVLLITQSLFFSVPGVIFGLLICYVLFVPISYYLTLMVGSPVDMSVSPAALALGIVLGLVLPLLGVTVPIRRALTKTIRDALDVYHNVTFDTKLTIMKLEDLGLSPTQTVLSIMMVVIGFMVYYMIPLSFTFSRLDLFFRIMTVILLGMVCGLVFLSLVVDGYLQAASVYGMTSLFRDNNVAILVLKNLSAHSSRNRKTSIMFTLCLGYIIFAATMFFLQAKSFSRNLEWFYGADVVVDGPGFYLPLPEEKLRSFLETIKYTDATSPDDRDKIVIDYTFATYEMNGYSPLRSVVTNRMAYVRTSRIRLFGIEKNYLDTALSAYYNPAEINNRDYTFDRDINGAPDAVRALFGKPILSSASTQTPASVLANRVRDYAGTFGPNTTLAYADTLPILLAESVRDRASIEAKTDGLMTLTYTRFGESRDRTYRMVPVALLKKFPGYPTITRLQANNAPAMISMDNYVRILNELESLSEQKVTSLSNGVAVPKGKLLIRLKPVTATLQIEGLVNSLNSLLENDKFVVTNLQSQIESTQTASDLIIIVFNVVAIVGITLSFFVLLLSFTANVRENSWELGVLRAVGLTKLSVIRVYLYEALAIVFSSTILGTSVGILTASTLTLQNNLFTEMAFVFDFPTSLFVFIVASSCALACVGSFWPINEFNKKPIAVALRG